MSRIDDSIECKAIRSYHGILTVWLPGRQVSVWFPMWWKLANTGIVERVQNKKPSDPITFTVEEVDLLEKVGHVHRSRAKLTEAQFSKPGVQASKLDDSPSTGRSLGLDWLRKLVKTFEVTETRRGIVHTVTVYQSFLRLPFFNTWVREPFGRDMIVGDVGMVVRMDGKLFLHYHHGSLVPVTTDDRDFQ
jgi:hypothetical protein